MSTSADERIERIVARILDDPRGVRPHYGDIDPDAPRLVGHVLATTDEDLPWHARRPRRRYLYTTSEGGSASCSIGKEFRCGAIGVRSASGSGYPRHV